MLKINAVVCQGVNDERGRTSIFFVQSQSLGTIYEEIEYEYGKFIDEMNMYLTFRHGAVYTGRLVLVC